MYDALAIINFLLAVAALAVFVRLAWCAKTAIRYVYGFACLVMVYVSAIYLHLFATGSPLGIEFTRPATGFMLIIILAVGVYELFRN